MDLLDRARIEEACGRLALLYGQYADQRDHEGLASLFSEDAVYLRPGPSDPPLIGRASIHEMFRGQAPRLARHLVTNVLVDVIDENNARGTSYLTVLYGSSGLQAPQGSDVLYVGQCEDEYVRTSDGWKIAKRGGALIFTFAVNQAARG